VDVVVVGGQPEEQEHPGEAEGGVLGRRVGEAAAHPLGPAGGARRVVHDGAGGALRGCGRRPAVLQLAVGAEALHGTHREAALDGEAGLVGGRLHRRGEALVGDQDLGLGVVEDVGDLGTDEVVVDRDEVPPGLQDGQVDLDHLHRVGQHDGDGVAGAQAWSAQAVDEWLHDERSSRR